MYRPISLSLYIYIYIYLCIHWYLFPCVFFVFLFECEGGCCFVLCLSFDMKFSFLSLLSVLLFHLSSSFFSEREVERLLFKTSFSTDVLLTSIDIDG